MASIVQLSVVRKKRNHPAKGAYRYFFNGRRTKKYTNINVAVTKAVQFLMDNPYERAVEILRRDDERMVAEVYRFRSSIHITLKPARYW